MRHLFLCFGSLIAAAGTSQALAADLLVRSSPPPISGPLVPPPTWNGFYVGGNIGFGWGASTGAGFTSFTDPDLGGVGNFLASGGNVLPSVRPSGVLGGGQIGYDWQMTPNIVAGVVTDI